MAELHDVVKLLIARMESHPEEFNGDMAERDSRSYRWWQAIRLVQENGTAEEKAAIDKGIRKIKLQHAHEMVMDELLNGDERRRREQEEQEYEANLLNTARNQRNMGSSLRAAITPALQKLDAEMQREQLEMYRNTYNQMGLTMRVPSPHPYNTGFVSTIKKALGL